MMKFVTLKMIVGQELIRPDSEPVPFRGAEPVDDTGEDDGLPENVVGFRPAEGSDAQIEEPRIRITKTQPVTIGLDSIRNFYPRKLNAPGTRVVLKSGVAYIVEETHAEVLEAIQSA